MSLALLQRDDRQPEDRDQAGPKECRSSTTPPVATASRSAPPCCELAGLRSCADAARRRDVLVRGGGIGRMAGAARRNAWWSAELLGPGDRTSADAAPCVSPCPAPGRGVTRISAHHLGRARERGENSCVADAAHGSAAKVALGRIQRRSAAVSDSVGVPGYDTRVRLSEFSRRTGHAEERAQGAWRSGRSRRADCGRAGRSRNWRRPYGGQLRSLHPGSRSGRWRPTCDAWSPRACGPRPSRRGGAVVHQLARPLSRSERELGHGGEMQRGGNDHHCMPKGVVERQASSRMHECTE